VIREVSEALQDIIHQATPDLGAWVELNSLSEDDKPVTSAKIALALIAVEEHPHLRNRPLVEGIAGLVRAPLSLRLHYLITYFGDHDECQTRLARVVQAFHTTPIVRASDLQPPLSEQVASLTIRMLNPTADERNQIWGTLGRPGRVALFYQVDVAPIEVIEREGAGRIREHRVDYVGAP